jgi:gamma-glutamyltranspeptidase/glutathione hydrolase
MPRLKFHRCLAASFLTCCAALFGAAIAKGVDVPTVVTPPAYAGGSPGSLTHETGDQPKTAAKGVVVSVSGPASDVGAEILSRGGNAVDAAIATAFALAVTYPAAGNIGGGGYMLVHPLGAGKPLVFDFRETAPAASTADMFVKPDSRTPHRLVGIPGTVRGLALAHQKFGKLPWADLVAPAVRLAGDGFALDAHGAKSLTFGLKKTNTPELAEFRRVFAKPGGGRWQAGDRLVQPDLKNTLTLIARNGADGFYTGKVADLLVAEMKKGGGLITKEDLAGYKVIERQPLHGVYRGHDVFCVPPSSSGGTALLEMLGVLENFSFKKEERYSPSTLHIMAEAMRRAYRDRARYLGDPAFVKIPDLLGRDHAKKLAGTINLAKATPSKDLAGDIDVTAALDKESEETTHLSTCDQAGMAVSLTYTLENSFGGKVVVPGAGFILNDEMNDFNWVPGVTDTAGRIGTPANLVAPGKRMLSSMCPTIVARKGKPLLVTGSPGGRTIINTVLCVLVNVIDFDMDVQAAVDAPRIHHQWFPDSLRVEPILAREHAETVRELERLGHQVTTKLQGDAHSIWIDPVSGELIGAADRRLSGKAALAK